VESAAEYPDVEVVVADRLATMVMSAGLVDWVRDKVK
jgi:hypothetical protein